MRAWTGLGFLALCASSPSAFADVAATCPAPVVVECDGAGNSADRAAWIAAFGTQGDCPPLASALDLRPGPVMLSTTDEIFCDLSPITLNGSTASIPNPIDVDGRCGVRLTDELWQSGSLFLTSPLDLSNDGSFSTRFGFRISNPLGICQDVDGGFGADGIVFVVQTVSNTAGGLGGEIGYGGLAQSVGIEFDTWENRTVDDGDPNHVGINLAGDMDSVVQLHVSPDFNNGGIWHAWIDYDGLTDILEVRVGQSALRPLLPTISHVVDLPALLGSTTVFPGFTSGTGCAGGWHDVFAWEFDVVELTEPCPVQAAETGLLTAEDSCDRWDSCRSTFTIVDSAPPQLVVDPIEPCYETLADAQAAVEAATSAFDDCSANVTLSFSSSGGCDAVITVVAVDECGNSATTPVATLIDAAAPSVLAAADLTLRCDEPIPTMSPSVSDDCDPAPLVTMTESRVDGGCPDSYVLTRQWTALDRCGHSASASQVIHVIDSIAPSILNSPADVIVECPATPPIPVLNVLDACDPAPAIAFDEIRVPGGCPGEYQLIRRWSVSDRCGNVAEARQIVSVVDTTPPVITAGPATGPCLWPPNHWVVCFTKSDFAPLIVDACGGDATWSFAGCQSDQPENDLGDGNTAPDCIIAPDGSGFCVRAERQGIDPAGRHYGVAIVAADACGNTTAPVVIGEIYVPHDQSPHEDCLKTTVVGIKQSEPLPF